MNQDSDLTALPDTWHVLHFRYIIMLTMLRYLTPNAGFPSLSNNIHNGLEVKTLGRFTCCW